MKRRQARAATLGLGLAIGLSAGATALEEAIEAPVADAEPAVGAFPTGTFVTAEWGDRFAEFYEDGTCRWTWPNDRRVMDCTYAVDGDLFTETDYVWSPKLFGPATYRWDFDGEYLTFVLVGKDPSAGRRANYQEQPYRYVPDPQLVVVAAYDIDAGTELLAGHTEWRIRPGADVPGDTLTEREVATGVAATVDITEGQPITPDLLEQPAG